MTKARTKGSKILLARVPVELHEMISKLAKDMDVTITYLIVHYLKFLQAKNYRARKNATLSVKNARNVGQVKTDFELDTDTENN